MARSDGGGDDAVSELMWVDDLRTIVFCLLLFVGVLPTVGCFPIGFGMPKSAAAIHTKIFLLACVDPTSRRSPKPLGTAFFIDDHGDIITAAHVIKRAIPFYARHHEQCIPAVNLFGTLIDVTTCTADDYDIVDCSLARNPFGIRRLPEKPTILELTLPRQRLGTPVEVIGYLQRPPDPVVSIGGIVGYNVLSDSNVAPDIVVEAHGAPGMSGGPILAPDGSVLGVVIDFNCPGTQGTPAPGMICDTIIGRPSEAIQIVMDTRKFPWKRLVSEKT